MACLYCGKEIGPIRLIRDSEFCSAKHRTSYQERLRKVLTQVAEPQTAVVEMATFADPFRIQEGQRQHTFAPLDYSSSPHTVKTPHAWTLSVPPVLGNEFARLTLEACDVSQRVSNWPIAPCPYFRDTASVRAPALPLAKLGTAVLPPPESSPALTPPDSISGTVHATGYGDWVSLGPLLITPYQLPAVKGVACAADQPLCEPAALDYRVAHTAAPAAAYGQAIAPVNAASGPAFPELLPAACECEEIAAEAEPVSPVAARENPVAAPAADVAVCEVRPSTFGELVIKLARRMPVAPAAAVMSRPSLVDEYLPVPAAQAVEMEVRLAISGHSVTAIESISRPGQFHIAEPWIPAAAEWLAAPAAEAAVRPVSPYAAGVLAAAAISEPVHITPFTLELAGDPSRNHSAPLQAEYLHTAAPTLAEAAAASVTYSGMPVTGAAVVELPRLTGNPAFRQPACATAGFEQGGPSASVPGSQPPNGDAARLQPISALPVAIPQPVGAEPGPTEIPVASMVALSYHCQRGTPLPLPHLWWARPSIRLTMPRLEVRAISDRLEELGQRREAPQKAQFAEVFTMPEAAALVRRPALVRHAAMAVAASLLVAIGLTVGVGTLKLGSRVLKHDAAEDIAAAVQAARPSAGSRSQFTAPSAPAGAVAWVRTAAAKRAAVELTDSFKGVMEGWGSASKGWSRNPEGYVHPGQLALFRPTLKYTDYRMEFLGQIESKGMSWVVRAKDPQNYYAMKFNVVAPGLRPILSMVHYPVVGGKKGHKVETPLSIMVHNNVPYHVQVQVKGNKFTTSIEGQEVDSWTDETLLAGGVGFFSDAGERARLYWMKVSKNDDWLGRICAFVAGDSDAGSRDTAWLQRPGLPEPAPERRDTEQAAILAGEAGEFLFSSAQRARASTMGRVETWRS